MKELDPHLCRVCGFDHAGALPWGVDGQKPSFEICACCGTEFGNDDATAAGVRRAREKWMKAGYPWFNMELRPVGWTPDLQVSNLIDTTWDPWA